ncbi:MAG TPA: metal-dependent transcriptional regulator [Nitrospirota bacterium]|nr:metal-dependent transcriptional regulator [Nitrospirota bacterium]
MADRMQIRGGEGQAGHPALCVLPEVEKEDELFESIWTLREENRLTWDNVIQSCQIDGCEEVLNRLIKDSWIETQGGQVLLLPKGEKRARELVRRHRLSLRLFYDLFSLDGVEAEACKFEHILSPEVTDSVCTLLGHPPNSPDGKPIPRGECCAMFKQEMKPLVAPLADLVPGEQAKIVFITPGSHSRLDRLSAMGVVPGSIVKLHQKKPSYVIQLGETMIAVDKEITREIFVKKVS